jgi:hypothetical protein
VGHPETHPDADNVEVYSEAPPTPRIPWERRKQIGSFRAYWRTAKIVMTRPQELEKFLAEPVNEKHAKYFRSLTFQFTMAMTFVMALISEARATRPLAEQHGELTNPFTTGMRVLGWCLALVGLFLATRSLEWFSRPKAFDQAGRERAVALSYYICAPILVLAIIRSLLSAIMLATCDEKDILPVAFVISLSWWAIFLVWYPLAVRALHFTTGQNRKRTALLAIAVPLVWGVQQLLMLCLPLCATIWFNMAWTFL